MDLVERIEALFEQHGHALRPGARAEPVSPLAHALQCAQLAEWAQADAAQVAAALLHDLGHFVDPMPHAHSAFADAVDDCHEMRALPLFSQGFGAAVIEPVRLHVQAKRYLVATDRHYLGHLSPAAVQSLQLQGGAMCRDEVLLFEELPYAVEAVALRRWDDQAKRPRKRTPPLGHYLPLLRGLLKGTGQAGTPHTPLQHTLAGALEL